MSRWRILLPISLLLSNLSCKPADTAYQHPATLSDSADRFEISDLTLQEGDPAQPIWQAYAEKASGGLDSTRVKNVVVTHQVAEQGNTLTLKAPSGILSPLTHDAVLDQAVLEDGYHRTIVTKQLRYLRQKTIIQGDGPIRIVAEGLTLEATSLIYYIPDGRIVLEGPIVGTIDSPITLPR
jgi:hypothetical protein